MKNRLKKIRIDSGLNKTQFAKKINVSQPSIGKYEDGIQLPSVDTIINICQEFNVSADWLLLGIENADTKQENKNLTEEEHNLLKTIQTLINKIL